MSLRSLANMSPRQSPSSSICLSMSSDGFGTPVTSSQAAVSSRYQVKDVRVRALLQNARLDRLQADARRSASDSGGLDVDLVELHNRDRRSGQLQLSQEEVKTHGNQLPRAVRRRLPRPTTQSGDDRLPDHCGDPDSRRDCNDVGRLVSHRQPGGDVRNGDWWWAPLRATSPDDPVPSEVSPLVVRLEPQFPALLEPRHGLPDPAR